MKKIISLFTALSFLLGTVAVFADDLPSHVHKICTDEHCGDNHEEIIWTAWSSDTSLPSEAGNYYLTNDVTTAAMWEVPDGINLCLNGHIIAIDSDQKNVPLNTINVNAAAATVLTDCTNTEHKFSKEESGRWTLDETNGTKTLTGGVIMCPCNDYAILANSPLYMYNINITGSWGGVFSTGRLDMHGCTVAGNTHDSAVLACGEVSMRDCSIVENKGDGVYFYTGSLSIGGKMIIADNTRGSKPMNLFLDRKNVISVDAPLEDGSIIGVATQKRAVTDCPVAVTGANDADYSSYFTSDNSDNYVTYSIQNGENNVVCLAANTPTGFRIMDDSTGTRLAAAPKAGSYTAILAIYSIDGNQLLRAMSTEVIFDEPGIKSIFEDADISMDCSRQVKLMLWDNLEGMKPCCESTRYLLK